MPFFLNKNPKTYLVLGKIKEMTTDAEKYALRGVSANKTDVHNAIQGLEKGLFPLAFCKILPDFAAGDPDFCNIMHAEVWVYVCLSLKNKWTSRLLILL